MKLSDMYKPAPNVPELSDEEAKTNTNAWSARNKPASQSDAQLVVTGVLLFFAGAYLLATNQIGLPPIQNIQMETPRGLNASETDALKSKMAKYHQPGALYNLIVNGQQ